MRRGNGLRWNIDSGDVLALLAACAIATSVVYGRRR